MLQQPHSLRFSFVFLAAITSVFAAAVAILNTTDMAPAVSTMAASLQSTFARWLKAVVGLAQQPGAIWKLLAILFALGNLKNGTFVWHVRSKSIEYAGLIHVPSCVPHVTPSLALAVIHDGPKLQGTHV
ncbi:unnamed protein product [Periconia digitata]|uniref:Uncharacterized protein n=1 Tax=Periconia digitata TaxID=1303443 RepID=A0A9W4UFP9_9PLEO|nr:unnamed protein product [Periconia digitata]